MHVDEALGPQTHPLNRLNDAIEGSMNPSIVRR